MATTTTSACARWLAFAGALLAGASVALSAYAMHGVAGHAQVTLQIAAVFAFGHGIALAALARQSQRTLGMLVLVAMLLGTLLFSGGLAVAHFMAMRTGTAPFGGTLLILAWLVYAMDALRR